MKKPLRLKVALPRIPDIELVAIEGLERLARHMGIAEEKIGEARIIVTEAIINAFEYACEADEIVNVEFTVTSEELVIFVQDFGRGFDPGNVEKPDIREKLGSPRKRGWGLHLMKSLSDGFQIQSGNSGTTITITKLLDQRHDHGPAV